MQGRTVALRPPIGEGRRRSAAADVERIAEQRAARFEGVDADLMRAARFERQFEPGQIVDRQAPAKPRPGRLAAGDHGEASPFLGMPADRAFPEPLGRRTAHHPGTIGLVDAAIAEVGDQPLARQPAAGDHHQPARPAVEPVNDPGPRGVGLGGRDVGEIGKGGEQAVDERALFVHGAGMDDESGRLVDDDDVRIGMENVERHRRRRRPRLGNRRQVGLDRRPRAHGVGGPQRDPTVDPHAAVANLPAPPGAAARGSSSARAASRRPARAAVAVQWVAVMGPRSAP